MTTLYATLGVQPAATLDEIKLAYRRAAMKWHPDRNPGREAQAHSAFQEIRNAYTILSDAVQRQIYDEVFEREMRRWQAECEAQEEQEREAQRVAQEHYEKMVAIAMRFADDGHNRDVIFGVLLGRDCEAELAARIADSTWALQESRRASELAADAPDTEAAATPAGAAASDPDEMTRPRRNPGAFDSFWHGLFGIRS